jgi:branched-chain amino acid transport system permease protein
MTTTPVPDPEHTAADAVPAGVTAEADPQADVAARTEPQTDAAAAAAALPAAAPPAAPAGLAGLAGAWRRLPTVVRHLAIAIVGALVIWLATGIFDAYRDYELAQIAAFVVAVAGLSVLIGLSGQISIGNGAFMAVGGYAGALLFMHFSKLPLIVIVILATCAAALAGAIFGVAAARLRGPYLAGATLMLAVALPSVATRFQSVLGGDQGLGFFVNVPAFLGVNFSLSEWQAWFNCGVALIVLVLLANLTRSRVGRNWRALRDDEVAASLAGLNVARLQIRAFIVSAACAGTGGVLLAVVVGTVSTSLFALGLSIQLLTAAVLGGLGTLMGSIWGSALLVIVPTFLANFAISHGMNQSTSSSVPILAYGVVLIAVMLAFPSGIQGGLSRSFAWGRRRLARHQQEEKGTT